jgi:hypothetical protein
MRNGTEAEITGGFKYGLTDDFIKILRASRQIKVVHLDSVGGRVGEAIRLNGVLREQRVDTYVSNGCYSACTVAFAAGRNRFLGSGAVLGFHAPAFPGMSKEELDSASIDQKRLFIKAGFNKTFVEKALSTPSADMWKPSADVLAAADVITGTSDGTDFAISGLGSDVTKDQIAKILTQGLPIIKAIKDRFPKDYEQIVSAYYDGFNSGKTEAEVTLVSRAKIQSMVTTLLPIADDSVLADFVATKAEQYQALGAKNPSLCFQFASGARRDFYEELPSTLIQRENDVNTRVIETAKRRQDTPEATISGLWKKVGSQMAAKGVGSEQLKVLTATPVKAASHGDYCSVSVILYREIGRLPQNEAGILMRSILAGK